MALGASSQHFELVHPPNVHPALYLFRLQTKKVNLFDTKVTGFMIQCIICAKLIYWLALQMMELPLPAYWHINYRAINNSLRHPAPMLLTDFVLFPNITICVNWPWK